MSFLVQIIDFCMFASEMKQFFTKITSFLMAFVVLFSTMGFTISEHYCGDILVETAIFQKAKTCGMDSDNYLKQETASEDCSIKRKKCCSEKQTVVEGQDELKISFNNLTIDQQFAIVSVVYTYFNVFEIIKEEPSSFNDYPPPLIVRHIFKLDESYLI